MSTRTVIIVAFLAGALGVAAGLGTNRGWLVDTRLGQAVLRGKSPNGAQAGAPAPRIELAGLDGQRRSVADLAAGRPTLVNLWASWCGPCLDEMPALDGFARRQGTKGVQVVGIALDDPDAVRAFLKAHPVGYPILIDAPGPTDAGARLGNTRGVLPYSVLLGADGRILRQFAGPLKPSDLDAWAADALRTRD